MYSVSQLSQETTLVFAQSKIFAIVREATQRVTGVTRDNFMNL